MGIDAGSGIVLEGARDVLISGNTFTGLDRAAVQADAATERALVSGNLLTESGRKLAPGAKWIDLGGARDSIARENLGAVP